MSVNRGKHILLRKSCWLRFNVMLIVYLLKTYLYSKKFTLKAFNYHFSNFNAEKRAIIRTQTRQTNSSLTTCILCENQVVPRIAEKLARFFGLKEKTWIVFHSHNLFNFINLYKIKDCNFGPLYNIWKVL